LTWKLGGQSIIRRCVDAYLAVCQKVLVVTGHYRQEIEDELSGLRGVELVHNPDYAQGMFSSVQAGIARVTEDFFLSPGDIPGISPQTLRQLIEAPGQVRIPTLQGKKGHPVFCSLDCQPLLQHEPGDSTLKQALAKIGLTLLPVSDAGILQDIDTPGDYGRFLETQAVDLKAIEPKLVQQ
jgi:molybdenum cofactor cytidylyltransferase